MLVLGRKKGKWIIIKHAGETLRIVINDIHSKSGQVKLGFEGPTSFKILREEVDNE